jgi:hypothetical protein
VHPSAVAIVNARGVPGTAACLARDLHDGRSLLLTTHHVLFGGGAREGEPVYLLDDYRAGRRHAPLGWSLWGKIGIVFVGEEPFYVDCAVASWADSGGCDLPRYYVSLSPRVGEAVVKTGAGSRQTVGVIGWVGYPVDQRTPLCHLLAPGQLLLKPIAQDEPFAAVGDSGALVLDGYGRAVGLLWGVNTRGEGLASPITAVLRALNIALQEPEL